MTPIILLQSHWSQTWLLEIPPIVTKQELEFATVLPLNLPQSISLIRAKERSLRIPALLITISTGVKKHQETTTINYPKDLPYFVKKINKSDLNWWSLALPSKADNSPTRLQQIFLSKFLHRVTEFVTWNKRFNSHWKLLHYQYTANCKIHSSIKHRVYMSLTDQLINRKLLVEVKSWVWFCLPSDV